MSQSELVKRVARTLDRLAIPFMLTGSLASSSYGEPRQSHDVDLVVSLSPTIVTALLEAFPPPEFYLSEISILEGIQNQGMFNLVWIDTGDKVDFWLLTDEPFDQCRFARRVTQEIFGIALPTSTAEDVILAKLRWDQLCGGSEKQFGDARSVAEVQGELLDLPYIDDWAARLGVADRWNQIKSSLP